MNFECIDSGGKLSNRLRDTIQKEALNNTFTSVAERYGLGATTVATAFESYTDILQLRPEIKAPRVLGLDECHLQKQMRPVYVDLENAVILDEVSKRMMSSGICQSSKTSIRLKLSQRICAPGINQQSKRCFRRQSM